MRITVKDGMLKRFIRDLRDTGEFSRNDRRALVERINRNDSIQNFSIYSLFSSFCLTLGLCGYALYNKESFPFFSF